MRDQSSSYRGPPTILYTLPLPQPRLAPHALLPKSPIFINLLPVSITRVAPSILPPPIILWSGEALAAERHWMLHTWVVVQSTDLGNQ
jgi:hypothetical protein